MDRAAQLVKSAIDNEETIRIVGDYDIDGINSIYILYSGLKRLGADVDYVVPHRVTDGYGINERLIDEAYDEGRQVIITCDNGIAAYSQIEHAKALGMTVVVTDHHGVPFEEKAGGCGCRPGEGGLYISVEEDMRRSCGDEACAGTI